MSRETGAVILHFRNEEALPATIEALAAQVNPPSRVLIVDNASGDGVAERLRLRFPYHEVLSLPVNDGYGAGMNAGIARLLGVGCHRVLALTHECRLEPQALERMEEALDVDPKVGVVGPLLLREHAPDTIWSAGGELKPYTRRGTHRLAGRPRAEAMGNLPRYATWLDGAALLYRSEALLDAGLFSESFFLYEEDVEHHLRFADSGWLASCVAGAQAFQDTFEVPPYLAIRNHVALCRDRHWWSAAALTASHALVRDARASARDQGWWRLAADFRGLRDAWTGVMNREWALKR